MSNHEQGCTPNFTGADDGPATTCHQSCPPPSSGSRSSTSPNPPSTRRKRCGCDGPGQANPTSTSAGAPTYAGSTSSTPSGSSKTHSAGPPHQCAPQNKPTARPGSPSPPTPNFASPAASSMTDAAHENNPNNPTNSHPPASNEGFVNSAHLDTPAHPPKSIKPGPGRPKAPENRHQPATQPSKKRPDQHPQGLTLATWQSDLPLRPSLEDGVFRSSWHPKQRAAIPWCVPNRPRRRARSENLRG